MSDDQQISLLITQSLRRELSPEESQKVSEHLQENEQAAKFAELSKIIEQSVAGISKPDSADFSGDGPGLSEEAKQRLKQSVSGAFEEKLSLSQAGLISHASGSSLKQSGAETSDSDQQQRQLISNFNLVRRLGQGGLGNVWLARDEKLNRNVAIKELRIESLVSPKSWQRFHREAEITGHLEHPNVVPLYQYGVDQSSGEPFYTMRFVGKRTLSNAIEEYHDRIEAGEAEPLCLHRLLSVFLDICQAIAYAHSRGVIHRDLKPENVALDNFGQVIVLDWGLAKVLEDSELANKLASTSLNLTDSSLAQTMHGDVIGTPLYMSPEQAAGNLDKIDTKTDVYGLGAILFAILTGEAPHSKSAAEGHTSVESVLQSISQSQSPQPAESKTCIPSALNTICAKAMARKQHLRYDSVQDLANAIESWMAGQSGKQAAYDTLRMEGRELRADLQSSVFNLERNVRFASTLPPIEALINAQTDEDISVWRERLATIYEGILRANPDYMGIAYCSVDGNSSDPDKQRYREIVRVERHSRDATNLRVLPKSKLETGSVNPFITAVANKKPGETHTSLSCDQMCGGRDFDSNAVRLLSAVPVYDAKTEDVFGFVIIDCDMQQMLRRQMDRRVTAGEIIVACDIFQIMLHHQSGQLLEVSQTKPVAELAPHFQSAVDALQTQTDFIDETNADIFGARLWFTPGEHGLMYLLKRQA